MKRMLAILCFLTVLLLCGCAGGENSSGEVQGGQEDTTLPLVQVEMPEYSLHYAGEMKELISTRETEQGLQFLVKLTGGNVPMFTLRFNVVEGELVTMLTRENGEKVPVSFAMEPVPEGISPEDEILFCTAQDQVNQIIASLELK